MTDTDMGPVISAVQAYGDARAAESEQEAHDEDAAQITDLQAQVTDLQAQLADCQASHEPPPPADPPKTTLVVGARAKDTDYPTMASTIGPIGASRWFSPGSGVLPATFTRRYAGTEIAPGVDVWASFNSASEADLRSYVASADDGTKMVLHHEPEGDFSSGAEYVAWFVQQAQIIHGQRPTMPTVHAAAMYEYRANGVGVDGSYVPPPEHCDIYTIDSYRRHLPDMVPLEQDDRVQRWLALVPDDKPIGITEYGRGLIGDGPETDAKRAELIATDAAYLRSLGRVVTWQYWWTSGAAGNWRFTDQASVDAWRTVAAT